MKPWFKCSLMVTAIWCATQPAQAAVFAQQFQDISAEQQAINAAYALSADARLTNVSFELVDLDPSDGIAPGLAFNDAALLTHELNASGAASLQGPNIFPAFPAWSSGSAPIDADPLQMTTMQVTSLDATGVSGYGPDTLYATVGADAAMVQQSNYYPWGGTIPAFRSTAGASRFSGPAAGGTPFYPIEEQGSMVGYEVSPYLYGAPIFTLSPKTSLVITGMASASLQMNSDNLPPGVGFMPGYTDEYGHIDNGRVAASTGVYFGRARPNDGQTNWSTLEEAQTAFEWQEAVVNLSMSYNPDAPIQYAEQKTFQLTLTNNSDVTMEGMLYMFAYADASPLLSTVPEPETPVLMGLGLVALAFAKRRQQVN